MPMSNPGIGIKDFFRLFQLVRKRLNSPQDYQALEEFQGQLLVRYLEDHGFSPNAMKVLDLGSGLGRYTRCLQSKGAKVTSLDMVIPNKKTGSGMVCANAIFAPFTSGMFDLVISISLIEHVKEPEKLVEEMVRITKPGGHMYISFPPFYSPVGGHHFSPWHLFGEKMAVWAFSKRKWHVNQNWTAEPYDFRSLSYETAFGSYGLYPRTIRDVHHMVTQQSLEMIDQSVKYSPINVSSMPVIGEFMTWQVQYLLRKAS